MHSASSDLDQFLADLVRQAKAGDRLPPIRALMQRFGVSQPIVQKALAQLKAQGVIASEIGRGTYVVGEAGADAAQAPDRPAPSRSVLLLRRSISVARGRVLLEHLQQRLAADGHRVLEVSYTDLDHAQAVLRGLPRFDACVIQSTFTTITTELLATLHQKCQIVAVDGTALVGADVEAVGTEWGEPLEDAVDLLAAQGHRQIAVAMTTHPLLATQMGLRRLAHLRQRRPQLSLQLLPSPELPGEQYEAELVDRLVALRDGGTPGTAPGPLPFTALVVWGVERGAQLRAHLAQAGLAVPQALSVVLLGRTDLPNEHDGFFDTVGCSVADQAQALYQAINAHWHDPHRAYGVTLIPVTRRPGASVGAPAQVG